MCVCVYACIHIAHNFQILKTHFVRPLIFDSSFTYGERVIFLVYFAATREQNLYFICLNIINELQYFAKWIIYLKTY